MTEEKKDQEPTQPQKEQSNILGGMANDFMSLIGGKKQNDKMADLIAKARESSEKSDVEDSTSLPEILKLLDKYKDDLGKTAEKYMGDIDFSKLAPTALAYYLEYEDERKNPSWKRRKHRFCPGIDINQVTELNKALEMSYLCYSDTAEEIQATLTEKHNAELVYAEVNSAPGKPANFIALERDQSGWSNTLEVIVCVRGTKTIADALTDLMCDEVEYRGGLAHGFIVESGKYLAETHTKLLEDILERSGKGKLKVKLIGHSLGAGAASICGIELNDHPKFDVEVIGFGCPALLSLELAEKQDFITTVVNDSDIVPRMSGISVANLLLDVMEFDWVPYAKRDLKDAVTELRYRQPIIFNPIVTEKITEFVEPMMEDYMNDTIKKDRTERIPVELYPPGKLFHFYRDGSGFSGNIVPQKFFNEIDVTRRMIDDHLFYSGYQRTFLDLMRQQSGDHHFRFEGNVKEG